LADSAKNEKPIAADPRCCYIPWRVAPRPPAPGRAAPCPHVTQGEFMVRTILATILATLLAAAAVTSTAALAQPANFKPCPFTTAELQAGLGVAFAEGKASPPLNAGALTMHTCPHDAKSYSLRVQSQVYQNPADAKKATMIAAGKLVPIPNDPDGAAFQEGQGDLTDPSVHYSRGAVAVNLRVSGIYYKDQKDRKQEMLAIREKLAKLRRVP
jgi:hypothetical protein